MRLRGAQEAVAMFLPSCSGRLLLKEVEMPVSGLPATLVVTAHRIAPCLADMLGDRARNLVSCCHGLPRFF